MMYEYTGKTEQPDLDQITADVAASAMTNKNLQSLRWDEDSAKLFVTWDTSLDAGDKTILDGIVGA